MPSEYSIGIIATGDNGEEIETTATVEADSTADAKKAFSEITRHVEYWAFEITHIDELE